MIILAFDSTAKAASVAITENDRLLAQYNVENGLTQSELLLPMAQAMLSSLHMDISEVNLFACTTGPGSFTGVRIGAALVKGLAFGKEVPCVEVSTLEALAESLSPLEGILVPVMDARRAQLYNAIFKREDDQTVRLTPDRAISIAELCEELKQYGDTPIYLCGDGYSVTQRALLESLPSLKKTPPLLISENAYSVARVAYRKYQSGEYTTDIKLMPSYLRVPQAERERLERLNT